MCLRNCGAVYLTPIFQQYATLVANMSFDNIVSAKYPILSMAFRSLDDLGVDFHNIHHVNAAFRELPRNRGFTSPSNLHQMNTKKFVRHFRHFRRNKSVYWLGTIRAFLGKRLRRWQCGALMVLIAHI